MSRREFSVAGAYRYDHRGPVRWVRSHLLRYRRIVVGYLLGSSLANLLFGLISILVGRAFNDVLSGHSARSLLTHDALALVAIVLVTGVFDLGARWLIELLGKRLARDARDELYVSLLGKSQTFHNRQRVGDIMARVANDIGQLSDMVVPGLDTAFDSSVAIAISLLYIAFLQPVLLLAPGIFLVAFVFSLRRYTRALHPISSAMRAEFGLLNAGLAETVGGIDVVKATAQERQELRKFETRARAYRDLSVQVGRVQARYLPPLLLAITFAFAMLQGLYLIAHGRFTVGGLVAYFGLLSTLRYPVFVSTFSWNLVQQGIASAERILAVLREETELDQNTGGCAEPMRGEIVFDRVSFSYDGHQALREISFRARQGQTVAIVGQTGSGKSTLVRLINRIYDVEAGSIQIDGIDVRDWSLDALRSQISTIEQDIFLFSRTVAENIAFGLGGREDGAVDRAAIEQAARDAQAHEFIMGFRDGYDTVIGERGITLSGGQRQRIAIARALLTDPRVLILDDSTSAIDSATEDEIQKAMRRLLRGRTTLLITHRLSQIRTADWVLMLHQGALVDQGTHTDLLARCALYRRIFAHYEPALPLAAALVTE